MKMTKDKSIALELEQAEKLRVLKELIAEGLEDVTAGRVSEWSLAEFLREARKHD
jgi:hypothetical protein